MINVINQTPIEYSKQSRDYQLLSRIYTALYNDVKMYIDSMPVWGRDIDNKVSTLRAKTLNFNPNHEWDLDELDAVISCFKYFMRKKGSILALEYCLTILMRIKRISGTISLEEGTIIISDNTVTIRIPKTLTSLGIIEDLINYLIPTGFTYRIVEYRTYEPSSITELKVDDSGNRSVSYDTDLSIYNSAESSENNGTDPGNTIYKNVVPELNTLSSEV